jgi:hypothetical protein
MLPLDMSHQTDNDDSQQTDNAGAVGRRVRVCGICFKGITYQWQRHWKKHHDGRDMFEAPS